jgi:hypothetical protein
MQLLHQLLQNPAYDYVLSIGRRKLSLKHGKLVQIEGDMNMLNTWDLDSKLSEKDLGGDNHAIRTAINEKTAEIDAFSSLGTTIKDAGSKEKFEAVDHGMVLEYALFAKKLGAKKFLNVSALGADSESKIFYNQVKGKLEDDLKEIGFEYVKKNDKFNIAFKRVGGLAGKCSSSMENNIIFNPQYHYFLQLDPIYKPHLDDIIKKINSHTFPSNTVGPRSLSKSETNEVLNCILLEYSS